MVRPPVAEYLKKHAKLGEDISEIEKPILAKICANCSIRVRATASVCCSCGTWLQDVNTRMPSVTCDRVKVDH